MHSVVLMMESILNTIIEESSANDGEHTEHYNRGEQC